MDSPTHASEDRRAIRTGFILKEQRSQGVTDPAITEHLRGLIMQTKQLRIIPGLLGFAELPWLRHMHANANVSVTVYINTTISK